MQFKFSHAKFVNLQKKSTEKCRSTKITISAGRYNNFNILTIKQKIFPIEDKFLARQTRIKNQVH